MRALYANVDFQSTTAVTYVIANPFDMSDERYKLIAQLRQKALDAARAANTDYLFVSAVCLSMHDAVATHVFEMFPVCRLR